VDVRVYSYVDISECVQGSYSIYVLAC